MYTSHLPQTLNPGPYTLNPGNLACHCHSEVLPSSASLQAASTVAWMAALMERCYPRQLWCLDVHGTRQTYDQVAAAQPCPTIQFHVDRGFRGKCRPSSGPGKQVQDDKPHLQLCSSG